MPLCFRIPLQIPVHLPEHLQHFTKGHVAPDLFRVLRHCSDCLPAGILKLANVLLHNQDGTALFLKRDTKAAELLRMVIEAVGDADYFQCL